MSGPSAPSPVPASLPTRFGWLGAGGPGATRLVLVVFLLVYFCLEAGSSSRLSATFDEPIHLTAGYAALVQHDYRVDPTHPPFLRMWAALPLLALEPAPPDSRRIDATDQASWLPSGYQYANDFLYAGPHAERNLNAARCMIILLGAFTGLLLFCWAREWLGFFPAVLGLVFFLLEPNLAAHAALVTTDAGITCFFFGTIYFFRRTWRAFTALNLAGLALFFSLACVSKFSAVLLVPAGGLLLGVAVGRGGAITGRRAAGIVGLLAVSAFAAIWAVHGFRFAPSATPGWLFQFEEASGGLAPLPVLSPLLAWIDAHHLLPNAYTRGFLLSVGTAQPLPSFLAGSISPTGWWYYYPVVFLLKTPLALLILLGTGLVVLARRRAELGGMNALHLLLPVAVYLAIAMTSGINIGLRHLLPIYPFVLLIAATVGWRVAAGMWEGLYAPTSGDTDIPSEPKAPPTLLKHNPPLGRARRWLLALGVLLATWLAAYVRIFPHQLTYFNLLAGGPENGANMLADSNQDWGQHLKLLKTWLDENGVRRVNLAYFGTADPDYYAIDYVPLPGTPAFNGKFQLKPELPGYMAISTTTLSGVYFEPQWRLFYSGFKSLQPLAVIGHTINVYRVERWPEPVETDAADVALEAHRLLASALVQLNWHDQAVHHFQRYLQRQPDDSRTLVEMGKAMLHTHQEKDARRAFERAVELDPQEGDYRAELISLLLGQQHGEEAVAAAREWVRIQPANPSALDSLGIALAATHRLAEAREVFLRAQALAPDDAVIREHLDMAGKELAAPK